MSTSVPKICLLGGPKTGKTAFARKLCKLPPQKKYNPTVGVEAHSLSQVEIWDIGGNAKFRGLFPKSARFAGALTFGGEGEEDLLRAFRAANPDAPIVPASAGLDELLKLIQ